MTDNNKPFACKLGLNEANEDVSVFSDIKGFIEEEQMSKVLN